MMSPNEIRRWALRRYPEWLCACVKGDSFFPREVNFGRPSPTEDFNILRAEFDALAEGAERLGYQIQWSHRSTKRWGMQQFPERVWYEDAERFLRGIGKAEEARRFRHNLMLTSERCGKLLPWVERNAVKMADSGACWPEVLAVAGYFLQCPEPNLYARQLPIPVPTKFIDEHRDLLRPILDFILGDKVKGEADTFNRRYSLLEDEAHVRLRFLDEAFAKKCGFPVMDMTVPVSAFRSVTVSPASVIVAENKMCFLTLPAVTNAVAVWGQGKAAALIHGAAWLRHVRLIYWGDMDDSGFSILSALRAEYPHAESMLMNISSWDSLRHLSHKGKLDSSPALIPRLSADEAAAWHQVRSHEQMIEQEQIPMEVVRKTFQQTFGD